MKTVRRLLPAMLGLTLLASTLTSCDWPAGTRYVDEVFTNYDQTLDVTYRTTTNNDGSRVDLKLNIYEPRGDTVAERPVVMWMFGGAWQFGDRTQLAGYAQDSARRGYVGITIDYRTWKGSNFDLVTAANNAYDDTIAAVAWLKAHAADYGLDPDAIVSAGYSAGAINTMHALHRPADSPVAGGVVIAGMSLSGVTGDSPPAIMFNGTEDDLVPYATASSQCQQSLDLGNKCQLVTYQGEGHEIGGSRAAEIRDLAAHYVFDEVLIPLGYKAGQVQAAA
jgi:acetyl esterase/lipase